ncbi:hypothetical protein MD588_11895 [Photobacterium sp. SDRW27]|uniref:COG3650 family protein n=1 Tax=Photobacterium obscurum TaxID=2829490 RepID=UPI002244B32C|nr:hypothetical protein [Photobacterium obscurum]MCW8329507.1 hypothetical protein [Photobacterium obscurum]
MTHLRQALPAAALLALIAGCTTSAPSSTSGPVEAAPAASEPITTADNGKVQAFMMRGTVVLGHESNSIQPCGSSQQYWLNTPLADRQALAQITRPGYQPMYGEFIGYLEPAPSEGFAADYDGRFNVKQINLISSEMTRGCHQLPHNTRAFGHEPGWVVEINGETASLLRPGQQRQQQAITGKSIVSGKQSYQGKQFSLDLTKGQCNDTMSDSLFGWQARLTWQGNQYQGCATLGASDITLGWAGSYQGISYINDNPVLTTTVTLHPDHSATTRYDYPSGDPSLNETGFWQQAGENHVQVIMTKHQGRRLISERLFVRKGKQITVSEEVVNGQAYSLGGEGLSLYKQ